MGHCVLSTQNVVLTRVCLNKKEESLGSTQAALCDWEHLVCLYSIASILTNSFKALGLVKEPLLCSTSPTHP